MNRKKAELGIAPPIDFWSVTATNKKEEDVSKKKHLFATFQVPLDLKDQNKSATYEEHIKKFSGGTPEEFCLHFKELGELALKLGYEHFLDRERKEQVEDSDAEVEGATKEITVDCWRDIYGEEFDDEDKKPDYVAAKKQALLGSTLSGQAYMHFSTIVKKWEAMKKMGTLTPSPKSTNK